MTTWRNRNGRLSQSPSDRGIHFHGKILLSGQVISYGSQSPSDRGIHFHSALEVRHPDPQRPASQSPSDRGIHFHRNSQGLTSMRREAGLNPLLIGAYIFTCLYSYARKLAEDTSQSPSDRGIHFHRLARTSRIRRAALVSIPF